MRIQTICSLAVTVTLSLSTVVRAEPSIVGGTLVEANDPVAKSTVALYMLDKLGRGSICTGSLINNSTVVTAAHCLAGAEKAVIIFARNVLRMDRIGQDRMRAVTGIKINPSYNSSAIVDMGDIAIAYFKGGIPTGYAPATVMEKRASEIAVQAGARVVIAGFGITGIEAANSGVLRKTMMFVKSVSSNQAEVLLMNPGRSACSGDSGGPAFIVSNGRYLLWGVTSRGDERCSVALYTKIQAYLKTTPATYATR